MQLTEEEDKLKFIANVIHVVLHTDSIGKLLKERKSFDLFFI